MFVEVVVLNNQSLYYITFILYYVVPGPPDHVMAKMVASSMCVASWSPMHPNGIILNYEIIFNSARTEKVALFIATCHKVIEIIFIYIELYFNFQLI